ncbi:hypothetical protein PWT90_05220 [Aphanocladium album]|nr:hypothetical protein PWT90_05220 [Aphanocladium album]
MSLPFVTGGYEAEVVDCCVMRQALALPEILRSIFEYLPQESLVAAMRANRFWFDLATDVLWRDVHVHYLNYIAWNRQQYYASKITTVRLRHVQARNAYVSSKYLKFPRIQKATFEGDGSAGSDDPKFLYPFLTTYLTSISAYNFDIGSTFFEMLNRANGIRDVGFSISPGIRFRDYESVRHEPVDKIVPEPSLNDLVARKSHPELIAAAQSIHRLIANRPKINRAFLAYGTDHLITKDLLLALARLRDIHAFYLNRPLSDAMAVGFARMDPPPFQSLELLTLTAQSYSLPKIAHLMPKLAILRLDIRDAESSRLYQGLSTLTNLQHFTLTVPPATKTTGDDLTWLAALTKLQHFTLSFNKMQIPWLSPSPDVGFGDDHMRIMVAGWSQLRELSLPIGNEFTENAFFALGHSCPLLKVVKLTNVREFSPLVFEPFGEPLFPCLHTLKLNRIVVAPPPDEDPDDDDEWWDRYVQVENISQQPFTDKLSKQAGARQDNLQVHACSSQTLSVAAKTPMPRPWR